MRKLLTILNIVQIVSNKGKNPKLGKGYNKAYRFNPYNPLTYIVLVIGIIVGIIMFGFVGLWKEVDVKNPFDWD